MVFLATRLGKPVLVEGPAGVGKTELGKALAGALGRRLIRLQCYEGLDEAKALYEWNYRKQLLRLQADRGRAWEEVEGDIFTEDFLLSRPLLEAIRSPEPVVLLIDEVDRVEVETEALLLEVLAEFQVSIPELGTVTASSRPRWCSPPTTPGSCRRPSSGAACSSTWATPPPSARREILLERVPGLPEALAEQVAALVRSLRRLPLRKAPSVSESIDWAQTLLALGIERLDAAAAGRTLHVVLKHQPDIEKAAADLELPGAG